MATDCRDRLNKSFGDLNQKAMFEGTPADGGYLVPAAMTQAITRIIREISPLRQISGAISIGSSRYEIPYENGDFEALWEKETESASETDNATLLNIEIPVNDLRASPVASRNLVMDSVIDIASWFNNGVASKFARKEGKAFVLGDGKNKPRGFNDYDDDTSGGSETDFNTLETLTSDNAGDVSIVVDMEKMNTALLSEFQAGARWVMNKETLSFLNQILDGFQRPIIQPDVQKAGAPTVKGHGVTIAVDMPDIATGEMPIALGDFRRGFLVVDRIGIQVLRDELTGFPNIKWRAFKRVGGGVSHFQAIKRLRIG
jgi:HK97 family phage major capsid protein